MIIKPIVLKASDGTLEELEVVNYSKSENISLDEFAHIFSDDIARSYRDGLYDFSFSNNAMNWLYGFLTDPIYLESNNNIISEFPLEVYLAFDAGEYRHSGDNDQIDPVKKYTVPAIEELLDKKNT